MIIRRALPDEAKALTALTLAAKASWGYPPQQLAEWTPGLSMTADAVRNRPTFVAEVDDERVGFYSLIPGSPDWELDNLWVRPASMRRGHGRELLRHALATAMAAGATQILIDADPHAEAFYLACGAVRVGSVPAPIAGQPNRVRPQLVLSG